MSAAVAILELGVTDAFGTGASVRTNLGAATPDGAAPDTFWDSAMLDVPGLTLTAVHCHGSVQYELQAGATGPSRGNACYAAMGSYQGQGSQWGVYELLPFGRAVYRSSENYGPWRYCIGSLIAAPPPTASAPTAFQGPPAIPC